MANIQPTQNFVLVQFVPKDGSKIFLPDGQRNPTGDIVVQAVGPDVPHTPPIPVGAKVLLRGDAKIFGIDDKQQMACIPYPMVMAVLDESVVLLTDAEIDALSVQN